MGFDALILSTPTSLRFGVRLIQVLLTDRFAEGLMLLRNVFGWHLIDMSYVVLNETSSQRSAPNKKGVNKGGVEDHRPSFDELSVQVPRISQLHSYVYPEICAMWVRVS